ncbi:MAG: hypothetical protein E7043_03265 [Lentisphaerae bacterium]|nr:hypothetical protein [Lentisphaerota bacterium]MBE6389174.1 hypothetical protein [Lentisphaerota bacterium]
MAKRLFLGTGDLLPDAIAKELLKRADGSHLPDFSRIILVLPGQLARKTVLQQLAELSPSGLLLPQIITPHLLLYFNLPPPALPSATAREIMWGKVLASLNQNRDDFPNLFPNGRLPHEKFLAAKSLRVFYDELTANGFSADDAAIHLGSRGKELVQLEKYYRQLLKQCHYDDQLDCDRKAAADVSAFTAADKIILAGLPDLPRLVKNKLELINAACPDKLEFWIAAGEEDKEIYDQWGMPVTDIWCKKAFPLPVSQFHCALDPVDAARRTIRLATDGNGKFDSAKCAIVLADPSLHRDFAKEFSQLQNTHGQKIQVIDPSGIPLAKLRICRLLETFIGFVRNQDDFYYTAELLREQDFLRFCADGDGELEQQLLVQLDKFMQEYIPDEFPEARAHCHTGKISGILTGALDKAAHFLNGFERFSPADFIRMFLAEVYRHTPKQELFNGIPFHSECEAFFAQLKNFESLPPELTASTDKLQLIEIFLRNCRDESVTVAGSENSIAFEGRLEMPFLRAKQIIFCGMNNEYFPDRIDQTAFLTDSLRRKIGMRSNRETLTRSLCHLLNVTCCRPASDINVIILRQDSNKFALRPSEVIFGGTDLPPEELLLRCDRLFRDPEPLRLPGLPYSDRVFQICPALDYRRTQDGELLLSVTDLDEYISSPFLFFWKRVKKFDTTDYSICEPDARVGGTLCHQAFEAMGCEKFTSCEKLKTHLLNAFDRILHNRFGKLPVLVKIYADNMKQRLEHASEWLYKEQEDGFEVLAVEYAFGGEAGGIHFAGAFFRGSADRIEFNRTTRTIRIIDIKTGKVQNVRDEHCRTAGEEIIFTRLQLPLYAILLKRDPYFRENFCPEIDQCSIECAYLRLPQNVTDTAMQVWPAEDLAGILPYAEMTVSCMVSEIKQLPFRKLYEDPNKVAHHLLLPNAASALTGISWETPSLSREKKKKKTASQRPDIPEYTFSRPSFPVPPASTAGNTRCCDCPEALRGKCRCYHGDCTTCKSFNGFKSYNIITASAGTGKTYSLASRFIRLLEFGADPASIMAITFTKKASGEIFDRIVRRICDIANRPHIPANACYQISRPEIISIIRKLLGPNDRELQISTIDSFFMRLLKAYAPELGIWGSINMIDEGDNRFTRKTLRSWIRSIHDQEELDTLRELIKDANASEQRNFFVTMQSLVEKVYSFYMLDLTKAPDGTFPQLEVAPWHPEKKDVMSPEECRKAIDAWRDFAASITDETTYFSNKTIAKSRRILAARLLVLAESLEKSSRGFLFGKLPEEVRDLINAVNDHNLPCWCDDMDDAFLAYNRFIEFPPETAALLRKTVRHIRALSYLQMRQKNRAVFTLMSKFDDIYTRQVRNAGYLTFADLPCLLRTMDPENRELMLGSADHSMEMRLDARIDHYMFDEFQDTSDVQFMAFDPLLRELFSSKSENRFRSFFCVGDIKQSIYQWRGGNPELFNYVKRLLRPLGEELGYDPEDSLSLSYRSSQVVLDTVNAVFAPYSGDAPHFSDVLKMMKFIPHGSAGNLPGHAAVLNIPPEGNTGQNIQGKAGIISRMLDDIEPLRRGITVGILVQTNKVAREFAKELRKISQLPISVEGRITPVESMIFNVFKELLILAEHPGDREAAGFLEAVTFSSPHKNARPLGLAGLAAVLGFDPDIPLDTSLRQELFDGGIGALAERFYNAFGNDINDFDRRHMEILRHLADKFTGTPEEFIQQAEHSGESGSSLNNTIQIMTCHKSKGLEFDVVFLPDTGNHRGGNGVQLTPDSEVVNFQHAEYNDGVPIPQWISYLPPDAINTTIPPFRQNNERRALNQAFEKSCNLYVAMTRAKYALYMILSCGKTASALAPDLLLKERLSPFGGQAADREFYRDLFYSPCTAEEENLPVQLLYSHGDRNWFGKEFGFYRNQEKQDHRIFYLPEFIPAESDALHPVSAVNHSVHNSENISIFDRETDDSGKNTGTQIHQLLETLKFIPADFVPEKFCPPGTPEAVRKIFCKALQSDSPIRQIFIQPALQSEIWLERQFIVRNRQKKLICGTFDRVEIIKNEKGDASSATIFDYKSDRLNKKEDFAIYYPQLQIYREALSILLNLPEEKIRCFICALNLPEIIETG